MGLWGLYEYSTTQPIIWRLHWCSPFFWFYAIFENRHSKLIDAFFANRKLIKLFFFPYRDVYINGYTIPAGSHVIPLINSVHMDPNLWDRPEEFNPRRFLDNEGKVRKPEYFMPFGVGRRMCLGDVLARMELFLFFASFMHSFNMSLPEGQPLPSLKGNVGVTITPESFKVVLTPRPLQAMANTPDQSPIRNFGSNWSTPETSESRAKEIDTKPWDFQYVFQHHYNVMVVEEHGFVPVTRQ